ncbi:hypothetical protein ERJ75_000012100 [Trypanosoma vivax]|nr:hypothetical protein ERJ75_000012100 [Trypanosoma vivax]
MGSPSSLEYLVDAVEEVAVANNIIKFPPDYRLYHVSYFVDIASAYVDYPASDVLGQPSSHEMKQRAVLERSRRSRGGNGAGAGEVVPLVRRAHEPPYERAEVPHQWTELVG